MITEDLEKVAFGGRLEGLLYEMLDSVRKFLCRLIIEIPSIEYSEIKLIVAM